MNGEKPPICAPMVSANHLTKPTLLRPSASATNVANHASVFHAAEFLTMSSQLTTPNTSISEMTTSAAVVALM